MIRFTPFLVILCVSSITACKKPISNASGNSSLVYESQSTLNLMSNYSEFVNKASLQVENATPYQQMVGAVMADARETTIDNNGIEISNIEFSNLRISSVELTCTQNLSDLNSMLQSCDLIIQYFDYAGGNYVDVELATFYDVNMQSAGIDFNLANLDLMSVFEKRPDRMLFKFQFNDRPSQDIELEYRIGFDYSYSYDERERKK